MRGYGKIEGFIIVMLGFGGVLFWAKMFHELDKFLFNRF
jgi:hypothetical protein